jgi:metal-responsive CopG/Arc/MetJ family transcriptional regulator
MLAYTINYLLYNTNMAAKPVQISIDEALLQRVDADPETRKGGRSAFVRSAIELYLRVKERKHIEAQILTAYTGQADALSADLADLIAMQAWPRE